MAKKPMSGGEELSAHDIDLGSGHGYTDAKYGKGNVSHVQLSGLPTPVGGEKLSKANDAYMKDLGDNSLMVQQGQMGHAGYAEMVREDAASKKIKDY